MINSNETAICILQSGNVQKKKFNIFLFLLESYNVGVGYNHLIGAVLSNIEIVSTIYVLEQK